MLQQVRMVCIAIAVLLVSAATLAQMPAVDPAVPSNAANEPGQAAVNTSAAQLPRETEKSNDGRLRVRVDVNLAEIDAVVQDRTGKLIGNLEIADFRLFEDGVEQPIQVLSKNELPLAIALVVDRTRMDGTFRPFTDSIKRAASQSLSMLKRGDAACLFDFSYTVEMLQGLTVDLRRVEDRIGPIKHNLAGGIPVRYGDVYVALYEATAYLARTAPDKRRAVILFSDNRDYFRSPSIGLSAEARPLPVSIDETIQLAAGKETVVYSIRPPDRAPDTSFSHYREIDHRVIKDSGGEIFEVSDGKSVERALSTAIGRLRAGYTLSYSPRDGGRSDRRIEIKLADRFGKPNTDYSIFAPSRQYLQQPANTVPPPASAVNLPVASSTAKLPGSEIEFVKLPSGSFTMGGAWDGPAHRVTLTRAFELGRFEVTQAQWQAVMGSNPSDDRDDSKPVNNVSWDDIQEFVRRMNLRNDGYQYRLPTEAEWEYAAHAGTTGLDTGEDAKEWVDQLDEIGWTNVNSGGHAHSVGQKKPNAWGLYDMHGNVWEWVADRYSADYGDSGSRGVTDPKGPAGGASRVLRGGSYNYLSEHAAVSYRHYSASENRSYAVGFRLLRERF